LPFAVRRQLQRVVLRLALFRYAARPQALNGHWPPMGDCPTPQARRLLRARRRDFRPHRASRPLHGRTHGSSCDVPATTRRRSRAQPAVDRGSFHAHREAARPAERRDSRPDDHGGLEPVLPASWPFARRAVRQRENPRAPFAGRHPTIGLVPLLYARRTAGLHLQGRAILLPRPCSGASPCWRLLGTLKIPERAESLRASLPKLRHPSV